MFQAPYTLHLQCLDLFFLLQAMILIDNLDAGFYGDGVHLDSRVPPPAYIPFLFQQKFAQLNVQLLLT